MLTQKDYRATAHARTGRDLRSPHARIARYALDLVHDPFRWMKIRPRLLLEWLVLSQLPDRDGLCGEVTAVNLDLQVALAPRSVYC